MRIKVLRAVENLNLLKMLGVTNLGYLFFILMSQLSVEENLPISGISFYVALISVLLMKKQNFYLS